MRVHPVPVMKPSLAPRGSGRTSEGTMKTLLCCVLVLLLAGCLPIGVRGTSIGAISVQQHVGS